MYNVCSQYPVPTLTLPPQGALGVMYYEGVGTAKDKELAFKNLCEASERGSLFAQVHCHIR